MICNNLQKCIEEQFGAGKLQKCDNQNKSVCVEASDTRSAVKCEEHGKKYVYENCKKNHVVLYKMDGGVVVEDKTVPLNTSKCDYLYVINDAEQTAILTELKGINVPKSLEQIKGTLLLYKNVFKGFQHVYARAVVTSSTPNLKATPAYTNLERMLRQTYRGNIKISERQLWEKDRDLDKK